MQIILIPGLMNDGWVWRHQIGALSRFGAVTVAHNDGCDTLGAMAARIVKHTSGPLAVVGHSMGGRVALEVVEQAPDRIAALALLDTGAGADVTDKERIGRLALVDIARSEGMGAVCDRWLPPMLGQAKRDDKALIGGIRAMLERCSPEDFARQQAALLARPDRTPLLSAITAPTLVATGEEDEWASPAQHQAIADAIPGATMAVVPGSGHMLPVEAPAALTDLLVGLLRGV